MDRGRDAQVSPSRRRIFRHVLSTALAVHPSGQSDLTKWWRPSALLDFPEPSDVAEPWQASYSTVHGSLITYAGCQSTSSIYNPDETDVCYAQPAFEQYFHRQWDPDDSDMRRVNALPLILWNCYRCPCKPSPSYLHLSSSLSIPTSFQHTGYRSVKLEKALRKVGTDFQLSNLGLLSSFLNSAPQAARRSFSYLFLLRRVRGSHG